jgi:hypothetical protein
MTEHGSNDARIDRATANKVNEGLLVCMQQGVNPALFFMEQAGVPRHVALRVLCSPHHFRKRERRKHRRSNEQHRSDISAPVRGLPSGAQE